MRLPRSVAPLAFVALVGLGACDNSMSDPGLPEPPITLSIVSGGSQSAFAFTQLPQPIVAQLLSSRGRPVKGQVVNFRAVSGGGSVWAGASTTDANGLAKDWWTVGYGLTTQVLEVRAVDAETGQQLVLATATATSRALNNPVARCLIAPDATFSVDAPGECGAGVDAAPRIRFGTTVQVAIQVTDQAGVPVPRLQLDFLKDGGGSFSPLYAVTNENGVATVAVTMGTTIPNNSLSVFNVSAGLDRNIPLLGTP
jgi:hypothetical protein